VNTEFDGVEWDATKSDANVAHRGFGFDFAADVFNRDHVQRESRGQEHDESRFVVIGVVDSLVITVVWTPRGTNRRIISARPASRKERRIYNGHRQKEAL
jgi:uncharacterized protein